MGVEIKVTTQELRNAAAEIRGITDRICDLYGRIAEASMKFPARWEGEAEEMHRRKLQDAVDRAVRAGNELKKRPDRLLMMTGIYEQTEQENVTKSQELDSNVIS